MATYKTETELLNEFNPTPPDVVETIDCQNLVYSASLWAKIHTANADPTVNADADHNYRVGNGWLNTSTLHLFVCTDSTAGAAVWGLVAAAVAPTLTTNLDANSNNISNINVITATSLGGNLSAATHNISSVGTLTATTVNSTNLGATTLTGALAAGSNNITGVAVLTATVVNPTSLGTTTLNGNMTVPNALDIVFNTGGGMKTVGNVDILLNDGGLIDLTADVFHCSDINPIASSDISFNTANLIDITNVTAENLTATTGATLSFTTLTDDIDFDNNDLLNGGDITCNQVTANSFNNVPLASVPSPTDPGSFGSLAIAYTAYSELRTAIINAGLLS